ncbi:MAG: DUF2268 domain-containing putative Zn-dependent protease [Alphaproteobacteria bacterium]
MINFSAKFSEAQRKIIQECIDKGVHDSQQQGVNVGETIFNVVYVPPNKDNPDFIIDPRVVVGSHLVQFKVQPDQIDKKPAFFRSTVERTTTHELNHIERIDNNGNKVVTLADALVSEGLAQTAELVAGHKPVPWTQFHSKADAEKYVADALKHIDTTLAEGSNIGETKYHNYIYWFSGIDPTKPDAQGFDSRFGGYPLGQAIVGRYLIDNQLSMAEMTTKPTREIIEHWKSDIKRQGGIPAWVEKNFEPQPHLYPAQQRESASTQPPTARDHPSNLPDTKPQVHSEALASGLADSRLNMAGNHAMNLLGFVPVALGMGSDIEHGNVKGAITTGGSFAAVIAAPAAIAKVATLTKIAPVAKVAGLVGEKAIPIVGSAFGAVQSGLEAHQDFTAGHVARGWLDTVKAGAYGTAAVAGIATAADCWNPTVIAPALVTGGALTVGVAIDAGESVYAHGQGIVSGAKSMWNWATGKDGEQNHVNPGNAAAQTATPHSPPPTPVAQKQAHLGTPDLTNISTSRMGRSPVERLRAMQSLAPDTLATPPPSAPQSKNPKVSMPFHPPAP